MEFYYSNYDYDYKEKVLRIRDRVKIISQDMFSRFHDQHSIFYKEKNFKVIIPNSVEKIEFKGFFDMRVSEYQIPNSVKEISQDAFRCNEHLKSMQWPSSVKIIQSCVLDSCSSLEEVVLPEGLEVIGYSAFGFDSSLTTITIPTTVESFDKEVFYGCENLKEIYVPKALYYKYGKDYFKSNTPAEVIPYDKPMVKNATTDSKAGKETTENAIITSSLKKEFKSFCGAVRTNLIADKRKK